MLRIVFAASAALLIVGCSSKEDTDSAAQSTAAAPESTAPSDASAAPEAVAAPEAGAAPTRDFIVGKWGEAGDCTLAIDFKADGSMDGPVEKWEYADGVLTMVGLPQKMHLKVIDDKTMESRADGTGDPHKLTRC